MSDSLSLNSAGKENNQNIDRNLSPSIETDDSFHQSPSSTQKRQPHLYTEVEGLTLDPPPVSPKLKD